jgi:hypothetical protein
MVIRASSKLANCAALVVEVGSKDVHPCKKAHVPDKNTKEKWRFNVMAL